MNLYRCHDCEHQFERKKSLKKCPECKSNEVFEASHYKDPKTGKWFLYKYTEGPYVSVKLGDSELKTLDHLGRRNFDRDDRNGIVKEKVEKDAELDKIAPLPNGMKRIKSKKVQPWWRDGKVDQSLGQLSETKQHDYIMTGKK